MPKPNPVFRVPPLVRRTRIIIDVNPTDGKSNLHTEGPMTVPLVLDILIAQTSSLWSQFIKSMTRPVVGANGEPTYKIPADAETVPVPNDDDGGNDTENPGDTS